MAARKVLPKPRARYYVEEPVIVLGIGEFEQILQHMISELVMCGQSDNIQKGLENKKKLLIKSMRDRIKAAKAHYKIKES